MEAKVNFNEIIGLISQLSSSQIRKLKEVISGMDEMNKGQQDLKDILKNGPVMYEDQYQQFLQNRELLNQWRTR